MARWLSLIGITLQVSCAGGGGSSTNSSFDPARVASVSISPPSAQVSAGASVQLTAIVQNASNPAVTWEVNGIPGGNSSVGTITPSGAATASYKAPASVSGVLIVTVTAVLQADSMKRGSATLTVNPLPAASITISPVNASVVAGGSVQFSANVQNAPQAVIWEVNGIQLGTPGTISATGFYAAPSQIPNPPVVTITAILQTNLSVSASTTLTIVPPPVSLSISPTTANVATGQTVQFTADVQNSSAGVIWQVNGQPGGDSAIGTISSLGTYTATYTAPTNIPANPAPFTVMVTAALQDNSAVSAPAGVTVVPSNAFTGVYSWRNDNSLTGQNAQEIKLTPASVGSTTNPFGKLFACTVADGQIDGAIFAQPLYVRNVTIPSQGTHNVVYVATENDSVYAFDADSSACQILWQVSFTDPINAVTAVPAADIPGQTDIVPVIGITGTPVIDPNTATLYVVSKTKVDQGAIPSYKQELHALDLTTGAERVDSPALIKSPVNAIAFDPLYENQRPALLLAGGRMYVAFDSYADTGSFHGWLFAYDAGNLQSAPVVFISTPNGSAGGIGQSGAALSADASGDIFLSTSDGTFDANTGGSDYAETLLKLQTNTLATDFNIAGRFTPPNEATLNFTRRNFGSTGVALLPASAGGAVPLALTGSEAAGGTGLSPDLYLLNRDNLGGFTSPGAEQTLCLTANGASGTSASVLGTPAYWAANSTIYVAAAGDGLKAFPLVNGAFTSPSCPTPAAPSSQSNDTFDIFGGSFGASPVISWDGTNASSGIVWALDTSGYTNSAPAILRAYDATNLANRLYASPGAGDPQAAGPAVKFAVPTVANGKVYVGTQGELSVFGLQ